MASKKITNTLLWCSFVCWIIILPVLIYCDSDENLRINIGFGRLFLVFLQLIIMLTGKAFDEALIKGPYIVAIFAAVILFLISLLWLIPCLKAKKRKTMIISAVNLAIINTFFLIMFIMLYSVEIEIGDYNFALYVSVLEGEYNAYHTAFLAILPFLFTIITLIPYSISIARDGKDLSDNNKSAKGFNSERKGAFNLSKGQLGASGRQAAKSMISDQELKSDPSSVSDLKSKVNRLKSQLENKDYTSSFKINNDAVNVNEYNNDFNDNDQTTRYVPTSELFIKPPRVNNDEFDDEIKPNLNRNPQLNANTNQEENFYNNNFSNDKPKVTSNLIYPTPAKNRFAQQEDNPSRFAQQENNPSWLERNQYPFDVNIEKPKPRVNRVLVDSKYNNKIVIGDTDKIWDATKKARQQYSKPNDNDEQ